MQVLAELRSVSMAALVAASSMLAFGSSATAQALPEIRLSDRNRVPACVTPARMMRFLTDRNPQMPAKFQSIAAFYKAHGERHRVRWDYAFFQMIIETNYLMFKTESRRGDVDASQNNFAGIGTTGGGVPGDSFPDVSTGVLGQIQHLIAYSGEQVANPVAKRTREKQDDIIAASKRLGRPVTFRDLSGRWAADRRYWRSIGHIADLYNKRFCSGPLNEPEPQEQQAQPQPQREVVAAAPARKPASFVGANAIATSAPPPSLLKSPVLAPRPRVACKVFTAGYGGTKNVLIRRRVGNEMHYTTLQVLDGREATLTEAFIRTHAQGGEALGEFANRDAALTSAFNHCPGGDGTGGSG